MQDQDIENKPSSPPETGGKRLSRILRGETLPVESHEPTAEEPEVRPPSALERMFSGKFRTRVAGTEEDQASFVDRKRKLMQAGQRERRTSQAEARPPRVPPRRTGR